MTSPRRSSRNHASSVSLDVQLGFGMSPTEQQSPTLAEAVADAKRNSGKISPTGAKESSGKEHKKSKSHHSDKKSHHSPAAKPLKRKFGSPPCSTLNDTTRAAKKKPPNKKEVIPEPSAGKRKSLTAPTPAPPPQEEEETLSERGQEVEENSPPPVKTPKREKEPVETTSKSNRRELTVKEVIEKRMRLTREETAESSPDVSLLAPENLSPLDPSIGIADSWAFQLPGDCLFANEALGQVRGHVPGNVSQFAVRGVKYLPLSWLMDEDGFMVPLAEPVMYHMADGRPAVSTLADALRVSGITVKRRHVGKELLLLLRQAGLVVHYAFVARLLPSRLGVEKRASSEGASSNDGSNGGEMNRHEAIRRTVAELIAERDRRRILSNGELGPPPVREYRPRNSTGGGGVPTGFSAAYLAASSAAPRCDSMSLSPMQSTHTPLKISDPEHLNRFIGMVAPEGAAGSENVSARASETSTPISKFVGNIFSEFDTVSTLKLERKILLISDYDNGLSEHQIAEKYNIPEEKIPLVIKNRVRLIREQTRIMMERRKSRAGQPVRRTNYVGLNIMMWRFFNDCRSNGISLTGKQLKEHALTIAHQLGLTNFKGSEGWLDAFKRRHKIDLRMMTGVAVNYEEDEDGNLTYGGADVISDDEEAMFGDDGAGSPNSPTARPNGSTDALLAQCTQHATALASVGDTSPLNMTDFTGGVTGLPSTPIPGVAPNGLVLNGCNGVPVSASLNGGTPHGFVDPSAFQLQPPATISPAEECSLIASIIRSTAIRVQDKELSNALDTIRTFIVTHDPMAMSAFVDLQQRLANSSAGPATAVPTSSSGDASGSYMNGAAAVATPPYVNGGPETASEGGERSVSSSETVDKKEEMEVDEVEESKDTKKKEAIEKADAPSANSSSASEASEEADLTVDS